MTFSTIQCWHSGKSYTYAGRYPAYTLQTQEGERTATPTEAHEIRREVLAKIYADRDVLACQSYLVDSLLSLGMQGILQGSDIDDFQWDSVENPYPDPDDWTLQECKDYCDEHGIDTADLPDVDPCRGWPSVNTVATALQKYQDHFDHFRDGEDTLTIELGIYTDGGWKVCLDTDTVGVFGYDSQASWTGDPSTVPVYDIALDLLAECRDQVDTDTDDTLEQYRDAIRDNAEPAEIYEWWLVSDWLCGQLRAIGEPVLEAGGNAYWGRTCTGQAYLMDGTLQRIADQFIEVTA